MELDEPAGYFLHLLTYPATYPVPRHVVDEHGEQWTAPSNIAVSGPFTLEEWRQGQLMRLSRNPRYFGRFNGNVQQVELLLERGWATPWQAYQADQIDATTVLWSEKSYRRQQHPGEFVLLPEHVTRYLAFDLRQPPFDDPRVRRALALAIDKTAMADDVSDGYLPPAAGGFVPPGVPGHSPELGLPHHPQQARRLLAAAGYPSGHGFPPVDFLTIDPHLTMNQHLQQQWREKLGLETRLLELPLEAVMEHQQHQSPYLFTLSWMADYPDPDNFLRVGVNKRVHWRDADYQDLLARASKTIEPEQRIKLYRAADKMLVEEAVAVPLAYGGAALLMKPWIKQYPMSPLNNGIWKDVVIEPH